MVKNQSKPKSGHQIETILDNATIRKIGVDIYVMMWIARILAFPFWITCRYTPYLRSNYLSLFGIINKAFLRNKSNLFLTFIFPLLFVFILPNLIGDSKTIIFSTATYIPLIIGTLVFSTSVVSFKRSSLLKRIGATKIKPSKLMIAFVLYYSYLTIISSILCLGIGIAVYKNDSGFDLSTVKWGYYIIGILFQIILSFSFGVALSSLAKYETTAFAFSLLLIIPASFVAGQFIPIAIINKIEVLRYVGWVFPQKGPTMLCNIAVAGGNPFSIGVHQIIDPEVAEKIKWLQELLKKYPNDPNILTELHNLQPYLYTDVMKTWESAIALFAPIASSVVLIAVSLRLFRWTSR